MNKSQADLILGALRAGASLTQLDAYNRFQCLRLAARVEELRRAGWDIEKLDEKANGKHFARYRLRYPNPVPKLPPAFPEAIQTKQQTLGI
jgi:Helix-turn-helix domain